MVYVPCRTGPGPIRLGRQGSGENRQRSAARSAAPRLFACLAAGQAPAAPGRRSVEPMTWRVVITDVHGRESFVDVADVGQLRHTWRRMLADHDVRGWKWRKLREPTPETCPRGHTYWPGWAWWQQCRCGAPHLFNNCGDCPEPAKGPHPPRGPGCGPIPTPPDRAQGTRKPPARDPQAGGSSHSAQRPG